MSRPHFDTLTEFGWIQVPETRKQIAVLLAGEGMTEPDLRKRLQYLRRPQALLAVLNPKKKASKAAMRDAAQDALAQDNARIATEVDLAYVRERVNTDGVPVETVADHMGWPVDRVREVAS